MALFRIRGEVSRLVSLADIRVELEEGELEAWQKLIRVLTHEIVNSVTPVNTLTTAMLSRLNKPGITAPELVKNLGPGIEAIRKRNSGLLDFVENFRRVSKVPQPRIREIVMEDFFLNLKSLLKEEFGNLELLFSVTENLRVEADEDLLVQLMINLLKNAAEAGAGRIEASAGPGPGGRPRILVIDNGRGIEKEDLDRIFIPFYSSKKDGSGIGLALSRQIMRLHRGTISVDSNPGSGTTFTLSF